MEALRASGAEKKLAEAVAAMGPRKLRALFVRDTQWVRDGTLTLPLDLCVRGERPVLVGVVDGTDHLTAILHVPTPGRGDADAAANAVYLAHDQYSVQLPESRRSPSPPAAPPAKAAKAAVDMVFNAARLVAYSETETVDRDTLDEWIVDYYALLLDAALLLQVMAGHGASTLSLAALTVVRWRRLSVWQSQRARDTALAFFMRAVVGPRYTRDQRKQWLLCETLIVRLAGHVALMGGAPSAQYTCTATQFTAALVHPFETTMWSAQRGPSADLRRRCRRDTAVAHLVHVPPEMQLLYILPQRHAEALGDALEHCVTASAGDVAVAAALSPRLADLLAKPGAITGPWDKVQQRSARVHALSPASAETAEFLAAIQTRWSPQGTRSVTPVAAECSGTRAEVADLEELATHFPPCLRRGVEHGSVTRHLKNNDRFYLASNLAALGERSVAAVIQLAVKRDADDPDAASLRAELTRRLGAAAHGTLVSVPPPTCRTMREKSAAPGNVMGCPFASTRDCANQAGISTPFHSPATFVRASVQRAKGAGGPGRIGPTVLIGGQ